MAIGGRIRRLREKMGISRDDVQKVSGLDRSYIARVEQGRVVPPLETLERIAAALTVPLYWLFYAEDDTPAPPPGASPALDASPATSHLGGERQLLKRLREVSGVPFEADPALLIDFARRAVLGKPEN